MLTSVLIDGQAGRRVLDEDVAQPHFELPKVVGYLLLYLLCDQVAPPLGSGQPDFALHPGHFVKNEKQQDQLFARGYSVIANAVCLPMQQGLCLISNKKMIWTQRALFNFLPTQPPIPEDYVQYNL